MTADSLIDPQLDDTGYSELFTVEDFIREANNEFKYYTPEQHCRMYWSYLRDVSQKPTRGIRQLYPLGTEIEDPYGEFVRQERQEYKFNHA